jgi:hypothetical protein
MLEQLHPTWPRTPVVLQQLAERAPAPEVPYLPSRALLPLLGPRISAEALFDKDRHRAEDRMLLRAVRAYTVRPLLGAKLSVKAAPDIQSAVLRLLNERLPGFDWHVRDEWAGSFEKYGIVHDSVPAPPHPETGEPMSLELFGETETKGAVVIKAATYSNVMFPGYNVAMYM